MRPTLLPTLLACLVLLPTASAQSRNQMSRLRDQMVDEEIVAAGVEDPRVIAAMRETPRHDFVPLSRRKHAYLDMALPIGSQQTISPPFVVAYMTEQLDVQPHHRVLEIGTGSGYQAAVLAALARDVYSIEIVGELGRKAAKTLKRLKYNNVHTRIGDGYLGWPEAAPFDRIIVTCSPENVPKPLVEQLREGGKMVIPVGTRYHQNLYLYVKQDGELKRQPLRGTFFVPMTGTAEDLRRVQPDPAKPRLVNGGFEELLDAKSKDKKPDGWYYLRQGEVVRDPMVAQEGERYLRFRNEDPGRGCRALQSLPIDGRKVRKLNVRFWAKGEDIRFGENRQQWPYFVVTFYDDRRAAITDEAIGPMHGSFPWTEYQEELSVPLAARDAIVRIGLLGAIGELSIDGIEVQGE